MSERPTTEPHVHVIPLGYGDHEANEGETYSLVQCRECLEMLAVAPGRRALAEAAQGAAPRTDGRAVQDDGPTDCREGHDFRLTTDFDGEPVRCGRCKCLPVAVQDDGLDVERLARAIQETILTTPDEFMGPGIGAYRQPWDDLADHEQRAVIRDAEALADAYLRAASPLNASKKETP